VVTRVHHCINIGIVELRDEDCLPRPFNYSVPDLGAFNDQGSRGHCERLTVDMECGMDEPDSVFVPFALNRGRPRLRSAAAVDLGGLGSGKTVNYS